MGLHMHEKLFQCRQGTLMGSWMIILVKDNPSIHCSGGGGERCRCLDLVPVMASVYDYLILYSEFSCSTDDDTVIQEEPATIKTEMLSHMIKVIMWNYFVLIISKTYTTHTEKKSLHIS